jgi:DNA-binding response OmpR family regulator
MAAILLVDDDADLTRVASRILTAGGHQVWIGSSVREALELLEDASYDLVVVDVVMPDKGGIELLMELHERRPRQRTLIMSGKVPLERDAIKALVEQYGAKGLLAKPFTGEELLAAIDAAMA